MSWLKVKQAAKHFGVTERTLRTWIKAGFPAFRSPSGCTLINLEKGDDYLMKFRVGDQAEMIARELIGGLKK